MRLDSQLCNWLFRLAGLWFASAILMAAIAPSPALAQSSENPWTVPVNLSHSGVTTNPTFAVDSDGLVHVIWQDDLENFLYTRFDGDQWTAPKITNLDRVFKLPVVSDTLRPDELPVYTGPNPLLVAGPNQDIFAFWIAPPGKLFTSRVKGPNFEYVTAWDIPRLITPDVASFAVSMDARGELHLAFVRTADDPANPPGIYYTLSKYSGRNWAVPVPLYESPYLRTLGVGEANVSIATAGTEEAIRIYVAWDNRPRKQILLTQSADGGKNWEEAALIAGPAPDSGPAGPFNIHVGAIQNSVVLVWQNGRADGACSQLYQSSKDAGATWSDSQPMIENLVGCAQSTEFVAGLVSDPKAPLYFLTETESQVYLSAWNGLQWSQLQEQPILNAFEDPEIFTQIDFGCHRASLFGPRLYIVGCDDGGGGEVWFTSRDLETGSSWFSPPVWSQPSPVTEESLEMKAVELLVTADGRFHAFYSQHKDPAIYYTSWDGDAWSQPAPVLKVPDGEAGWPAIAAGPGNELLLIAPNNRGTLYFSRATSGNAAIESNWSTPIRLEIGHEGEIGSVDLAWDTAGTVSLAYSVPVNEERGIYLVQSQDDGTSWSEPLQVFRGAAAGFEIVGAPALFTAEGDVLGIVWKQQSIQGEDVPQPLSLYYTRSEDGGQTFTDVAEVIDEPVVWREILMDGQGNLHLLWQSQDSPKTVWDQFSVDGGVTWEYPQGLPAEGELAAVTRDPAGRLHLVTAGVGSLSHWLWDGSRWQSEPSLDLPSSSAEERPVEFLSAAADKKGRMMIVLAKPAEEGNVVEDTLLFSFRTLERPNQSAVQDATTPTPLPPTLTPATSTPEPSPIPSSTVESEPTNSQGQTAPDETNTPLSPYTMALLPVALLLLSVLGFVIRQATRAKNL